jgi:hypothetical protein
VSNITSMKRDKVVSILRVFTCPDQPPRENGED